MTGTSGGIQCEVTVTRVDFAVVRQFDANSMTMTESILSGASEGREIVALLPSCFSDSGRRDGSARKYVFTTFPLTPSNSNEPEGHLNK